MGSADSWLMSLPSVSPELICPTLVCRPYLSKAYLNSWHCPCQKHKLTLQCQLSEGQAAKPAPGLCDLGIVFPEEPAYRRPVPLSLCEMDLLPSTMDHPWLLPSLSLRPSLQMKTLPLISSGPDFIHTSRSKSSAYLCETLTWAPTEVSCELLPHAHITNSSYLPF